MEMSDRTLRCSAPSGTHTRGLRCLAMTSALILFGLYSSCGGGGGGGGGDGGSGSCANSKNIDGEWLYYMLVTDASGSFCAFAPGDEITDFGTILQADRSITYYSGSGPVYTGEVCGKNMDLYAGWTPGGSFYAYEEWIIGEISPDEYLMTGYGDLNTYDSGTGDLVCSVAYIWDAYKSTLVGGGDGQNGAIVFNYDDEANALVFARSTDNNPSRTQILGAVPPREYGDFTLPPGYWDLYMTHPGEHTRHFELAR